MSNNVCGMEMQAKEMVKNCDKVIAECMKASIDEDNVDMIYVMDSDKFGLLQKAMIAYRDMTDLIVMQSKALDKTLRKLDELEELNKKMYKLLTQR